VYGFVTIEPFRHQSLRRASHWQFCIGNLAFDDGVNDGVQLLPREANARSPMILPHDIDPFFLVERKPLIRVGLYERIVAQDHSLRLLGR